MIVSQPRCAHALNGTLSIHRVAGVALAATLLVVAVPDAFAATVPINFTGTEQTFSATVDLSGQLVAEGGGSTPAQSVVILGKTYHIGGPFVLDPNPTTIQLGFQGGPVGVNSTPISTNNSLFNLDPQNHITEIDSLDLDIFNGASAFFFLNQLQLNFVPSGDPVGTVPPLLSPMTIDAYGTLASLTFQQNGAGTFTPGSDDGTGTFSVPGKLQAGLPDLQIVLFQLLASSIPTTLNQPFSLTGSYTVSNKQIMLDGSLGLAVPLTLGTAFNTGLAGTTIDATVNLLSSITLAVDYHLISAIPEPGSVVLLAIGLAALVPVVRHRWKQ